MFFYCIYHIKCNWHGFLVCDLLIHLFTLFCLVRVHSLQPHAKTVLATIHDQLLRTTQGGTNTQLCYYTNTCEHRLPVEVSNCIVFDIKVWSLMHTYQSIGITEKETKYKSIVIGNFKVIYIYQCLASNHLSLNFWLTQPKGVLIANQTLRIRP